MKKTLLAIVAVVAIFAASCGGRNAAPATAVEEVIVAEDVPCCTDSTCCVADSTCNGTACAADSTKAAQ
ncbi:MAG: hypothetical protein LBU80_01485 [Rikenellaceae bacterium]|jgi:hypothetical protein|nr:hypothetical protein [Rikenellaceae bacterium]